jgi:hypothetical protein
MKDLVAVIDGRQEIVNEVQPPRRTFEGTLRPKSNSCSVPARL